MHPGLETPLRCGGDVVKAGEEQLDGGLLSIVGVGWGEGKGWDDGDYPVERRGRRERVDFRRRAVNGTGLRRDEVIQRQKMGVDVGRVGTLQTEVFRLPTHR